MSEKAKRKGGPIRFIWHRAVSYPIPFSYEVQSSLEHVVHTLPTIHFGLNEFIVEGPLPSSDDQAYHFMLNATDDDTIGQIVPLSDTTSQLEGMITLKLRLLYASIVMVILGSASIFATPKEFCGLPILLIGCFGLYTYRPHNSYEAILEMLETSVKTIEETPPYEPALKNHPQVPKHSHP